MRAVEKRRHEWLLGRWAAKEAVQSLLERELDLRLPSTEIEIVPDPYGRPQVEYCGAGPLACGGLSTPPSRSPTAMAPPWPWRSSIRTRAWASIWKA